MPENYVPYKIKYPNDEAPTDGKGNLVFSAMFTNGTKGIVDGMTELPAKWKAAVLGAVAGVFFIAHEPACTGELQQVAETSEETAAE